MTALQRLTIDLHLHTVLSPCAEVEMIPPLIVRRAQALGLDIIAVTDHNCAANVRAVIEAAQGAALTVLPGMEVQSREEVHLLCLFDSLEQIDAWEEIVSAALPALRNNADLFGAQYVVDATGKHVYTDERLLSTSISMPVQSIVNGVNALGGICLPAHVDRPVYSILANLGFIPPGLPIAGVGLSSHLSPARARERFPQLAGYGIIVNSDAHRLDEMAAHTQVHVGAPTVSELRLALSSEQGRRVEIVDR